MRDHPSSDPPPLILFDGVCNLCNATVRWVIDRDPRGVYRFASLQSDAARAALDAARAPRDLPDSIVLIDGGRIYTRSDAVIRIAGRLGVPWSLARVAVVLPRFVRDGIYAWIARRRYRWFGRHAACLTPTPALAERLIDTRGTKDGSKDSGAAADVDSPAVSAADDVA